MTRMMQYVRQLAQQLESAQAVCRQCGDNYGNFVSSRLCTSWSGKCDLCGEPATVTHPRNYGYFHETLGDLRSALEVR